MLLLVLEQKFPYLANIPTVIVKCFRTQGKAHVMNSSVFDDRTYSCIWYV